MISRKLSIFFQKMLLNNSSVPELQACEHLFYDNRLFLYNIEKKKCKAADQIFNVKASAQK